MATFYLLPPRPCLEDVLTELLHKLLPGLPLPQMCWEVVAEALAGAGHWPEDVFLVPRDDLPEENEPATALAVAFGATPGDVVVEVPLHGGPVRRWAIPQPTSDCTAATVAPL